MIAIGKLMTSTISDNECIAVMLNVPVRIVRRFDDFQRYNLGCLLSFLKTHTPHNRFIIPAVRKYKAPAENLSDISFEDFMFADTFFSEYADTSNPVKLKLMVAALYREKVNNKRLQFDEDLAEQWADDIAKEGMATLEAIAVNYSLVRKWLQEYYPAVFPQSNADEDANTSKKNNSKKGWLDVFDALVGDDGVNEDRYKQMRAINVLRRMNKQIIEQRKKKR